jgi:propanol-preferring alcohol dehydrogenase
MRAQLLKKTAPVEDSPLELVEIPIPQPGSRELLVKVSACGVCHTELDEIEGRLKAKLPVILGHEIIGTVEKHGLRATRFQRGDRIGIAWIYKACGKCTFCLSGNENLCSQFQGTGCEADGGYAEYTVVPEDFAYPIPERFTDAQAAPLLCAGAIGYRDLRLAGIQPGQSLHEKRGTP